MQKRIIVDGEEFVISVLESVDSDLNVQKQYKMTLTHNGTTMITENTTSQLELLEFIKNAEVSCVLASNNFPKTLREVLTKIGFE